MSFSVSPSSFAVIMVRTLFMSAPFPADAILRFLRIIEIDTSSITLMEIQETQ